ncbi:hypothetical protein H6G74_08905 [Nostoc spongiaeforme FACHB-130]|uniref:Uncharacterized protein n=1 Tax=Nostoc spongiaeforme FACHB-130 TaxID=1357510 RepID=A0ABR8FUF4_9NOSO|nr:hypothetical protein [Nostoc spongiaeforme]MBD2594446.1 hypothetical protein [Nostoc spongiaeforme FACHB-130]
MSAEEPLRWGDSAVGGFPDLRRLSSALPTPSVALLSEKKDTQFLRMLPILAL